jgi:hypothetical protein
MPLDLSFDFLYFRIPTIVVDVVDPSSGRSTRALALLDTGAEVSVFDQTVASDLRLDLRQGELVDVVGLGGELRRVPIARLELRLLGDERLSQITDIAFAHDIERGFGNIIGLDVLQHFDFAISHGQRTGYLGRSIT